VECRVIGFYDFAEDFEEFVDSLEVVPRPSTAAALVFIYAKKIMLTQKCR